jgi:hypothetical protein
MDKISCCFKCCFEYFAAAYKLKGHKMSYSSVAKALPGLGVLPVVSHRNILYDGVGSPTSISHNMVTDNGMAGNISIFQVTTLISTKKKAWKVVSGRRIVLVTPVEECIPSDQNRLAVLSAAAPFGNPRVSGWYTTQLPCGWGYSDEREELAAAATVRGIASEKPSATPLLRSSRSEGSLSRKELLQCYMSALQRQAGQALSKMVLIPMGVRDAALLMQAISTVPVAEKHSLLIDCTCALNSGDQK